jgi:hypothetical protein
MYTHTHTHTHTHTLVFITEGECVYCAVRSVSLHVRQIVCSLQLVDLLDTNSFAYCTDA